jgi:hypothetical protein
MENANWSWSEVSNYVKGQLDIVKDRKHNLKVWRINLPNGAPYRLLRYEQFFQRNCQGYLTLIDISDSLPEKYIRKTLWRALTPRETIYRFFPKTFLFGFAGLVGLSSWIIHCNKQTTSRRTEYSLENSYRKGFLEGKTDGYATAEKWITEGKVSGNVIRKHLDKIIWFESQQSVKADEIKNKEMISQIKKDFGGLFQES